MASIGHAPNTLSTHEQAEVPLYTQFCAPSTADTWLHFQDTHLHFNLSDTAISMDGRSKGWTHESKVKAT